ncbi:hypothetical protein ACQEPW_016835 [Xanthomonas oryzae pv. oryzicola]
MHRKSGCWLEQSIRNLKNEQSMNRSRNILLPATALVQVDNNKKSFIKEHGDGHEKNKSNNQRRLALHLDAHHVCLHGQQAEFIPVMTDDQKSKRLSKIMESYGNFLVAFGDFFFGILWSPLGIIAGILLIIGFAILGAILR